MRRFRHPKAVLQNQGYNLRENNGAGGWTAGVLERPLRILFALEAPWTERLGVPRVSIELSRQLERLGHRCTHYASEDAFPDGLSKATRFFRTALFQRRLMDFVRRRGPDFDVIQLECNLAPFAREAYRFRGILVAKSNGLPLFYERWQHMTEPRLKRQVGATGTWAGNGLRALGRWAAGGTWGAALRTLDAADVVHVLNADEQAVLASGFGLGHKVTLVPNGLSDEFHTALRMAALPSARADASPRVAFVGQWGVRKGQAEFPRLVRRLRETCPRVVVDLLGTGVPEHRVVAEFDSRDRGSVRVQAAYEPRELPALLASAKVGLLPSYIEGFPLSALEMMAAGLPVVGWDVPGLRDLVPQAGRGLLVPPGNVGATAAALLAILKLPAEPYTALSSVALEVAGRYTWRRSADCFLRSLEPLLGRNN